ncbi:MULTISPECIES: hypothetical protein [unclassified Kitasatospora]|uniref:hypothetical protein n=1 Tax=unclassified Kitasatospora TaxID=2633591 RepID=UPI00344725F6
MTQPSSPDSTAAVASSRSSAAAPPAAVRASSPRARPGPPRRSAGRWRAAVPARAAPVPGRRPGPARRRRAPLGHHDRRPLGLEGRIGTLAPGAHADLLLVDGDPLADLTVLTRPDRRLRHVIKAGTPI